MSDHTFLGRKRTERDGPPGTPAERDRAVASGTAPDAGDGTGLGSSRFVPTGIADPAVIGVALVTAAYVGVFLGATDVVGGTVRTLIAVSAAGICGVALAGVIGERTALRLTALLFVATLAGYYFTIPASQRAVFSVRSVGYDVVSLLTGLSVLRLALADLWILAVAPVPTFLVGYLAGRGRHVTAAALAGGVLGFLVLTGDAGETATLAGVVGVALAAGASTLSTPGGLRDHGDTLAAVLAAMILVSATVTVLPTGAAQPWALDRGNPDLESTLGADDEVQVVGPTRLSPEVRYTIESPIASNWHTGSYDTYTGDGWVRSGEQTPFEEPLDGPPGDATSVNVTITPETETRSLPAPWQAVDVRGAGDGTVQVDERGSLRLGTPLEPGEETTVESRVIDPSPAELRNASEEYDPAIEDRYTQLPESTPDRLGERTDAIVSSAGAETPYDKAAVIEQYLMQNYEYSLTVERPDGDVADAFLFEMDAGYCVYFATTMVAMLRSEGIPAQFVTGYTTGQQVSEDRYVVRGQNAHAWVKVYFPEHGWVEFDPTPSSDRNEVRQARLAEARANGDADVDTPESEISTNLNVDETPRRQAPSIGSGSSTETNGTAGTDAGGGSDAPGGDPVSRADEGAIPRDELQPGTTTDGSGTDDGRSLPSGDTVAYWLFVVAIGVAGARHLGVTERARLTGRVWIPWSRRSPTEDAKRAFAVVEHLLARRYRERRPGETPRAYLEALHLRGADERALSVGEVYERAAYAGTVTREEADEAKRTARRLTIEGTPVLRRLIDRR